MIKKQNLIKNWYWIVTVFVLLGEAVVFLYFGDNSYIGIHDNLDIHIADYQILKQNHAFFSQNIQLPVLGGINRDFFLTEWSLYAFLYMLFPNFTAYMIAYFLKILIAIMGGVLLGKDILQSNYRKNEWIIVLGSLTYGLLPLYPAFSFSFASLPYVIFLIRRLQRDASWKWCFLLFLYPLFSYFIFFGVFIMGYYFLFIIYQMIRYRKTPLRLAFGWLCLFAGYMGAEYRLVRLILSENVITIRDTMVITSNDFAGVLNEIITAFISPIFHAEDLHKYFVLPVVFIFLIQLIYQYIVKHQWKAIGKDCFIQIFCLIILNCVISGLYTCSVLRDFLEMIIPPLKGWQFNRTVFFNSFLWYLEIVIIAIRLTEKGRKKLAVIIVMGALLVVGGKQSLYIDFYNTVYTNAYKLVKHKDTDSLNYKEFYSSELFERIKNTIDYQGEYAVAYGFHPAVLSYNGIATLDACYSFYEQSYKDKFREVIEPALIKSEAARIYYDEWGGRAYIFSGTDDTVWKPVKNMMVTDQKLYINMEAFKNLGGTYIFSRICLSNQNELSLTCLGSYTEKNSPYIIYVYKS